MLQIRSFLLCTIVGTLCGTFTTLQAADEMTPDECVDHIVSTQLLHTVTRNTVATTWGEAVAQRFDTDFIPTQLRSVYEKIVQHTIFLQRQTIMQVLENPSFPLVEKLTLQTRQLLSDKVSSLSPEERKQFFSKKGQKLIKEHLDREKVYLETKGMRNWLSGTRPLMSQISAEAPPNPIRMGEQFLSDPQLIGCLDFDRYQVEYEEKYGKIGEAPHKKGGTQQVGLLVFTNWDYEWSHFTQFIHQTLNITLDLSQVLSFDKHTPSTFSVRDRLQKKMLAKSACLHPELHNYQAMSGNTARAGLHQRMMSNEDFLLFLRTSTRTDKAFNKEDFVTSYTLFLQHQDKERQQKEEQIRKQLEDELLEAEPKKDKKKNPKPAASQKLECPEPVTKSLSSVAEIPVASAAPQSEAHRDLTPFRYHNRVARWNQKNLTIRDIKAFSTSSEETPYASQDDASIQHAFRKHALQSLFSETGHQSEYRFRYLDDQGRTSYGIYAEFRRKKEVRQGLIRVGVQTTEEGEEVYHLMFHDFGSHRTLGDFIDGIFTSSNEDDDVEVAPSQWTTEAFSHQNLSEERQADGSLLFTYRDEKTFGVWAYKIFPLRR